MLGYLKKEDRVWTQRGIDHLKKEKNCFKWGSPTVGSTVSNDMDACNRHDFYMHGYLKTEAFVWTQMGIDYLKKENMWVNLDSPTAGGTVPDRMRQSVRNRFHDKGYLKTVTAGK